MYMKAHLSTISSIEQYPVIPVYYHDDPEVCSSVLKACYEGGIRIFEFTNRGANAAENFSILMKLRDEQYPDLQLGIGTIKTADQAGTFLEKGADFVVSPIVKAEIAEAVQKENKLWIPGCMTPTEISLAEELGATLIKLFPGDILGPAYLKSIKPLFPDLKFMPTGGVELTHESISSWLNAGVSAIGFGSKLFARPDSETPGFAWLSSRCQELLKMVNRK